ncbi:hypothetical protein [Sporosarcina cascadiensis]|uniref:hypothetical protein n=1 Tax=Sporosarcina cascadiensis TaxID=2660747 RepID=UPI00129AB64B|nr:hypothetical protein [Sporosarcina cascadiensis]
MARYKVREYLEILVMTLIIIAMVLIFDFPRTALITVFTVAVTVIVLNASSTKEKATPTRKRLYAGTFGVFAFLAIVIYYFKLPSEMYIMIGVLALSNIFIYELFYLLWRK